MPSFPKCLCSWVLPMLMLAATVRTGASIQQVKTAFYDPSNHEGWPRLFCDFLNQQIGNTHNPPLNFTALKTEYNGLTSFHDIITREHPDFIFAPAAHTACLQAVYDIAPILTHIPSERPARELGLVFVNKESNITEIEQIRGKTVSALNFFQVTGFVLQSRLLHEHGVHLIEDALQVRFYERAEQVFEDVRAGRTEVGFASGFDFASYNGSAHFEIIGKATGDNDMFLHLDGVPDFALSAMPGSDADVEEAVMQALLAIEPTDSVLEGLDSAGFEPPASYMGVRNVMEHEGLIFVDSKFGDSEMATMGALGVEGGWQCLEEYDLFDYLYCPPMHWKPAEESMAQDCFDIGLDCPGNAIKCICHPCHPVPQIELHVTTSLDEEAFHICERSQVCGVTQQRRPIHFEMTGVDVSSWHRVKYRTNTHDEETGEQIIISYDAEHTAFGIFEFDVESLYTGRLIIEVLLDDEQVPMSPVYVQVLQRDCNLTETGRAASKTGACECEESRMEVLRQCLPRSTFFMSCLFPVGGIMLVAILSYMNYKIKAADAMWIIELDDLKFKDPPEVLGHGAHGEVLKAVYMGSEVAVKHAIKRNTQRAKGVSASAGYSSRRRDSAGYTTGIYGPHTLGGTLGGTQGGTVSNALSPIQGDPFGGGFGGGRGESPLMSSAMRRSVHSVHSLNTGSPGLTESVSKVNQAVALSLTNGNASPNTGLIAEQLRAQFRTPTDSRPASPLEEKSPGHSRPSSPNRSPRLSTRSEAPHADAPRREPHVRAVIRRRSIIHKEHDIIHKEHDMQRAISQDSNGHGNPTANGGPGHLSGSATAAENGQLRASVGRERSAPIPRGPETGSTTASKLQGEGGGGMSDGSSGQEEKGKGEGEREDCQLGLQIERVEGRAVEGRKEGEGAGKAAAEMVVEDVEGVAPAAEEAVLPGQVGPSGQEAEEAEEDSGRSGAVVTSSKRLLKNPEDDACSVADSLNKSFVPNGLNPRRRQNSDDNTRRDSAGTAKPLSPPTIRSKVAPSSPLPGAVKEADHEEESQTETRVAINATGGYSRTPLTPGRRPSREKGVLERFLGSRLSNLLVLTGHSVKQSATESSTFQSLFLNNWKHRSTFVQEMRLLSRLRHPCITTVMGAVMNRRDPMLVMEFMLYGSLHDLCKQETIPFDGGVVHPIMLDICSGMLFLHSSKPPIIHTDMKAANVLVDERFRAKIADFGLSLANTRYAGTPLWMAPELLSGAHASTASDVYALGVTLNEVLSRKAPYDGEDDRMVLQVVRDPLIFYRPKIPPTTPKLMQTLIKKCWAFDPRQRPSVELIRKTISRIGESELDACFPNASQFNQHASGEGGALLRSMFPPHVAEALMKGEKPPEDRRECATVFFCDIVGFTTLSSTLETHEVSDMLDRLFRKFDAAAKARGVYKLETIGDCYIGVTNLVTDQADSHAVRLAQFAMDAIANAKDTLVNPEKPDMGHVVIRVGFDSGPVVGSVVGTSNKKYTIFGNTVNTASRMESTGVPGCIQCTDRAADLVRTQSFTHGGEAKLTERGSMEIKGKGKMRTFFVQNVTAPGLTLNPPDDASDAQSRDAKT